MRYSGHINPWHISEPGISKLLMRPSSPLSAEAAEQIEDVLQNAELISSYKVPPNVITMYSQGMIADSPSGQERKLTGRYPADAEPSTGFVSLFLLVGTSVLGSTVGQFAQWSGAEWRTCFGKGRQRGFSA